MYSLNKNIWLNELKKRTRANKRHLNLTSIQEKNDESIIKYIIHREDRLQVMQVVTALGEICKKILLAFYYDNLSMNDILQKLNYENEQVVRNKKYKCLKELEKLLTHNKELAKNLKSALHYE